MNIVFIENKKYNKRKTTDAKLINNQNKTMKNKK